MSWNRSSISRLLLPALIMVLVFYVILPLAIGPQGFEAGICTSVVLILIGALTGGFFTSDIAIRGTSYDEAVITKSRDAASKEAVETIDPITNKGLYIGFTGIVLLLVGILLYAVLGL